MKRAWYFAFGSLVDCHSGIARLAGLSFAAWLGLGVPSGFAEEQKLTPELARLAAAYAQVEAWEGDFNYTTQNTSSKQTDWSDLKNYGQTVSHGSVRLKWDERYSDIERGRLQWLGTATGAFREQVGRSQHDRNGASASVDSTFGGALTHRDATFSISLNPFSVALNDGSPYPGKDDHVAGEDHVNTVWREYLDNAQWAWKTKSVTRANAFSPVWWVLGDWVHAPKESEAHLNAVVRAGPGVLQFLYRGQVDAPGADYSSHPPQGRSRLTLFPIYNDVEVEVTIDKYETWLPKGNIIKPDEPGSELAVKAKLVARKPSGKALPKVKRFTFYLDDVSREPGICMNWPRLGNDGDAPPARDPNPDLRFSQAGGASLSNEALTAEFAPVTQVIEGREIPTATAQLDCLDYGAHGELHVECLLEDGRKITGVLHANAGNLRMIPVPWADAGSVIAETWRDRVKMTGMDSADLDDEPVGDGQPGDGFSNYEEYRGFVIGGVHLRTKPAQKDLFVLNKIGRRAKPGLFLTTDISRVQLHSALRPEEMPKSRRMNINRSADSPRTCAESQYQCGVTLETINEGTLSSANIIDNKPFRPQYSTSVVILTSLFAPGEEGELESTIAHELLHVCGIHHHGKYDTSPVWQRKHAVGQNGQVEYWFEERASLNATTGSRIRIFDSDGLEIAASYWRGLDTPMQLSMGWYHQQHSGDVDCVMRYNCAYAFAPESRPRDRIMSPIERSGLQLCTSPAGTLFNAPGAPPLGVARYADATLGNCTEQICVRDDAPEKSNPAKP